MTPDNTVNLIDESIDNVMEALINDSSFETISTAFKQVQYGLGEQTGVKTSNYYRRRTNKLSYIQRENLRYGVFLFGNLVEIPPESMCDKFFVYESEMDSSPILDRWMRDEIDKVCIYFKEALEESRTHGGAAVVIHCDDQESSLQEPLNFDDLKTVEGYSVLNSEELHPFTIERSPASRNYGSPLLYSVSGSTYTIHTSRLIKFHGIKPSCKRLIIENRGWGYSVIDRAVDKIQNFDQSSDAIAESLLNFNQTILFIKDLAKKIASGQREKVRAHIRQIAMLQSVLGILALDAQHEKYEIHSRNYQNIDTILEHLAQMAAGACDIPITMLLNRSATASNNKGGVSSNSGLQGRKEWAEIIHRRQNFSLKTQAHEFIKIMQARKDNPINGNYQQKYNLYFPPIFENSDLEQSQIDENNSRTMKNLRDGGYLTSEEGRIALAGRKRISAAIDLNTTTFEESEVFQIQDPTNSEPIIGEEQKRLPQSEIGIPED